MRLFVATAALLLAFFLATAPRLYADAPASADLSQEAASAWAAAVDKLDLQTQRPGEKAPPAPSAPANGPDVSRFAVPEKLAKFLLWGGLAVLLAILVFKLADHLRRSRNGAELQAENIENSAPEAVAARLDQAHLEAEELARRGRFAQAMHLLLLRGLGEMRLRLKISIAASLTSREIVARAPLGVQTRAALADLVGRVEISHFGAHEPGEAEYAASRASFEMLTHNLRAGGRA